MIKNWKLYDVSEGLGCLSFHACNGRMHVYFASDYDHAGEPDSSGCDSSCEDYSDESNKLSVYGLSEAEGALERALREAGL